MPARTCDLLTDATTASVSLTKAEVALILQIRGLQFGSMEIQVQNGIPVFIEKVREKIKLV
jgi:hypothetical protein